MRHPTLNSIVYSHLNKKAQDVDKELINDAVGDWVGIASDNTDNEYKKREGERTDERDTYCRRER